MGCHIPRKIFLRLGGLTIKSLINVVPQRFFLHTAPLSTLLSFCSTRTLHFSVLLCCRHLTCCNIQIQELFTCGRPIFFFDKFLSFSSASAILLKVFSVLGLFEDWVWAGKVCFFRKVQIEFQLPHKPRPPCLLTKILWISQNLRNSLFYLDFYCNNFTKSRRPQAANATLLVNLLCNTYISFELQVRKDWKAVIQVETEDLNQMPIVDFAPGEFLTSNEFGFEVGPICFS